ncbi:MAG: IPT/TIG domain-containing protein, partial [Vicinamibacterales bacterium]
PSPAPVSVSSVNPNSGLTGGGTIVTITGTGFLSGVTVTFGATPAGNIAVSNSGIFIIATTPPHAAGSVGVEVRNPNGQSGALNNGFTYNVPFLISSVTPNMGTTAGGTIVTIGGTGMLPGVTVRFGGTFDGQLATNVSVASSGTSMTATTPPHAAGLVGVFVTNPNGQAAGPASFFYIVPLSVSSVTPNTGTTAGGTVVTIRGAGMLPGATVSFGGTFATNVSVAVSLDSMTVTTPPHAAGLVSVVVTNPSGASASPVSFTYVATP